jgi:glycerate kinase
VITGEGKLDAQSKNGKVISGIAQLAKKYKLPVVALAGKVETSPEENKKLGIDAAFSITDMPMKLEQAIQNTGKLIELTTSNIIKLWLLGFKENL